MKFAANEVSKNITIKIVNDTFKEDNENFRVVLSGAVGFSINHGTSVGVIRNDDNDYIFGGASTTSAMTIGGAVVQSSVDFSTDQDWWRVNLVAGTTYKFSQNAADGSSLDSYLRLLNSSGVQLAYNDDGLADDSIISYKATTSGVYYLSAQGAGISIGSYTLTGVVAQPVISISSTAANAQKNEGSNVSMPFTFTVSRSNGNGTSVVSYSVAGAASGDQGAASASDFSNSIAPSGFTQMPSGTVTFAPGQTSQTITVGVMGDTTVERDERFSVTLSNPVNAALGTSVDYGVIKNDDVATKNSADIFRAAGLVNGDGSTDGIFEAGKIRVMADFSKAAYLLQPWETSTRGGNIINDASPFADQALNQIKAQGWVSVDLSPNLPAKSIIDGYYVNNQMASGFYTNGNAAAFVARSADAVVISIRGTNDNAAQYSPNQNNSENGNYIHPDVDQWGQPGDQSTKSMVDHYDLLADVFNSLDKYIEINGISHIYVTGHSLGGAMAIAYMESHLNDVRYQGIVFAAPAFTTDGRGARAIFPTNNQITQIVVDEDPVPATWLADAPFDDLACDPPGKVVTFYGNKTGDDNDSYMLMGMFNDDNHSMDFYRQITKSVDAASWQRILMGNEDKNVAIGASSGPFFDVSPVRQSTPSPSDQYDTYFIVDGRDSRTGAMVAGKSDDFLNFIPTENFDYYYGGMGNDSMRGSPHGEVMLGGAGDDTMLGGFGHDTLVGGAGRDIFLFELVSLGADDISDFQSGVDKIRVSSQNFGSIPVGNLSAARFVAGRNPTALNSNAAFLYDTATGNLTFDSNGTGFFGTTLLATLTNAPMLLASDIQVVMT